MNLLNKNARGWLIGAALILYLFPFYSLVLNKWPGLNLGELYTLGLELKDFLTVWTTLGGVVAVVIGIIQTQGRISLQKEQFQEQQRSQQDHFDAQRELQLKEQRDARFASGVELLGNPHESTRIGGVYNLYFLARESDNYLDPVCEILFAHLRSIAHKDKFRTDEQREKYPANEVQTIIDLLFKDRDGETIFKEVGQKDLLLRTERGEDIIETVTKANLRHIFLLNVNFNGAELNNIDFAEAKLNGITFLGARLSEVKFGRAELGVTYFDRSKLNNIGFSCAKLSRVSFNQAELNNVLFSYSIWSSYNRIITSRKVRLRSELNEVSFRGAKLNDVYFPEAELNDVDFSNALMEGGNMFMHTRLVYYTIEEIVKPGRSLELTSKKQEENPETSVSQ